MKEKRRKPVIVGLLGVLLLTTLLSLTVYGDVPLRGSHQPGRIIASAAGPTSLGLSDFRPVHFSPDGKKIVFRPERAGNNDIWIYNLW